MMKIKMRPSIKLFKYLTIILAFCLRAYLCNDFLEEYDETVPYFTDASENSTVTVTERITSAVSNSSTLYERNAFEESNVTDAWNATDNPTECPANMILPMKGTGEVINHSLKILLMLLVIAVCFIQIYFLMKSKFHYVPESSIMIFTGALFGGFFDLFSGHLPGDFKKKEAFNPTTFFLFLLPPIIYESAYNLHKGNFFKNFGSILFFAIFGTGISAFIIGGSIFLLGQYKFVYELSFTESFAYGSFLSAVDPVATLAVFQALDVDPILSMLVTGESIVNDAVAIVLAGTVWEASQNEDAAEDSISYTLLRCTIRFTTIFVFSAFVGLLFGLLASLLFKHVDFRKYPWMEFSMMLIFIYAPYCVAEVLQLSAIMAILFNGIVMSHYTHFNLSRLVQSIMQVTLRSMAFIAETCVFAYLGVTIFSYRMMVEWPFVAASIALCLVARAINIFPLSVIVNLFREHEISPKMMFIMWFSAIRGAVSFALALRFEFEEKKRNVIISATLIIVLFTTIVFGGGTKPLLTFLLRKEENRPLEKEEDICPSDVCLIKTEKMGETIDAEKLSDVDLLGARNFFNEMDGKYLTPFFTRSIKPCHGSDSESKTSYEFPRDWYSPVPKNTGNESS